MVTYLQITSLSCGFKKAIDQPCDVTSEELVAGQDGFVANIQR